MHKPTLSENLEESTHFTAKLVDDVGNLILLIILGIIPIVNLIVAGYGAEIIRRGEELDSPPKLTDFGRLFIDGLKIVIAIFLYALIPLIIGVLVGLAFSPRIPPIYSNYMPWWSPWLLTRVYLLPVLSIMALIGIIFAIFGVMGVIHMIRTDSFSNAFAFSEILSLIEEVGWGEYIIWLIIMYVIGSIVAWISSASFIVGAVIGVFYAVFVARSSYHIYPRKNI